MAALVICGTPLARADELVTGVSCTTRRLAF
jgi:hypothetical protein